MNGKAKAAVIAPRETNLKEIKINKKNPRQIKAPRGLIPKTIPREVATPLPPLNPAYTGNTCPKTEENPPHNCKINSSSLKPI